MLDNLEQKSRELDIRDFSITKYFDIKTDDFLRLVNESHRTDMIFEFQVNPVFLNSSQQSRSETGNLKIPHSDWLQHINNTELDRFELITIRVSVAISHLHAPFVEALKKIREADYGNTSEFFRDLVRDYLRQRQERRLEALLLEGLESGKATPFTKADFEAIKKCGLEHLKNKAKR